ncbi:hypothetical protein [Microbacterium halotolerans]|uniref:hypothetical protein n=1 Tax=Microbacterium halotolerans TaxID=246613 RepID=UPI0019691A70|nr:hypothetical protein [Microbacterium halotolerans]
MTEPDWSYRGDYIRSRSLRKGSEGENDIEPAWANEAYTDESAIVFRPDPASASGQSDRTIGWSETAGLVVTVITTTEGTKVWGVNAWKSNGSDVRRYERGS